jgi:hypothetical protein
MLCLEGEQAYVTTPERNPEWLGGYADPLDIQMLDAVFVCGEWVIPGIYGGRFPTVRWILYTPGLRTQVIDYPKSEMLYLYSKYYTVDERHKIHGILGVYDFKQDFFVNQHKERKGTCYTIRKGGLKRLNQHPEGSSHFEWTPPQPDSYFLNLFNSKERFISYDDVTMFSLFAALCGCESIVVPGDLSAEEWREKIPYLRYGVSYGFSQYERDRARDTRSLIPENLKRLEKESTEQVKGLVVHVKEALCCN